MKLCLFIYKGLYCQEMSRVWHLQERTCEVLSAWRMPVADSLQLQHLSQFYIFPRQLPSQWLSMVEAQAATISAQRGLLLRQATLLHSPLGCSRLQIIALWSETFSALFFFFLSLFTGSNLHGTLKAFPAQSCLPSPPFIFHSYCPPNKPLTPNSNCELLTSPSASWSLQIDDTGGNYWWEDLCMFLSSCLVFEKLRIPTSSNVQHTTNFVLNTGHKRIYL